MLPLSHHRATGKDLKMHTPSGAEDESAIMERLQAGDESALDDLLARYWKPLVKYAVGLLGDLDSSEDVVQESFVRLWKARESWSPTGTAQAFLYRVVRNLSLQENEKRGVRVRFAATGVAGNQPFTPAEELDRKRLRLALQGAIDSLSDRRREVVVLARFHGLSYKQIAEVMGVSAQTVANQMTSALRDLRKVLASI